jgi:hypothetical protein
VAVRGEELAVALSTTPDSTSTNAWPARPYQALPRQIPGSIRLRAFRNVPSDARVRADHPILSAPTHRGTVLLIANGSISMIGPIPMLTGEADYLLYVGGKAIGVVDAKPKRNPLIGVKTTSSITDALGRTAV